MNALGIMQGRLSVAARGRPQAFPRATWQQEFFDARDCRFDRLEWLVSDDRLEENPLLSDHGVQQILRHVGATGVRVTSLCADCFMSRPFVRVTDLDRRSSVEVLKRVIARSARIGVEVVLIPVLEAAAIRDRAEGIELLEILRDAIGLAAMHGIRVGLESDLTGVEMRWLIDQAGLPALAAYYDVGNATALGHDVAADVRALGPALCGVHIKDRRRAGPSVPLGRGEADFSVFFEALSDVGYTGPLILETPVGDDPLVMARSHQAFVQDHLRACHGARAPR